MGELLQGYLVPHPPIIIPLVGRGRESDAQATIAAYERMAEEVIALAPARIILLTPHGNNDPHHHVIRRGAQVRGDLGGFGAHNACVAFENDEAAVADVLAQAEKAQLPMRAALLQGALDHGALIPLYYLRALENRTKVVHIATGMPLHTEEDRVGALLYDAVQSWTGDTVLIVSGDLSHKLSASGPYGYDARGMAFETAFEAVLRAGDLNALDQFDGRWCNDAGQCGVAPMRVARGLMPKARVQPEILSHEWPYGVGYMVARLMEVLSHA